MGIALNDIAAERSRQRDVHGYTTDNDDHYPPGELATAGATYALRAYDAPWPHGAPDMWPWHQDVYKGSTDPRRDLVKAAALIVAEIERLDRARGRGDS